MTAPDATGPAGRPIRVTLGPVALILLVSGFGITAWPSGQVGVAIIGLVLLWMAAMLAAWQSGPMIRFGGTFFLACAVWAALGFGFPGSFNRWPNDHTSGLDGGALPQTSLTDDRYKGMVALNASVRSTGTQFVVTNLSTQPWQDVTLVIIGASAEEYDLHMPRTFIVTAEIGAGGPAGVYAARL